MWDFILLFPGVILHEISHLLGCLLTGTRVTRIKLWGLREAYIKHEEPGPFSMLVISLAPFFINSGLSAISVYLGNSYLTSGGVGWGLLFYWLALSFAYHAFPSLEDVRNGFDVLTKNWFSAMSGKRGAVLFLLSWVFFVPVFLPVLVLLSVFYIFSKVDYLGIVWFVLIAFGILYVHL